MSDPDLGGLGQDDSLSEIDQAFMVWFAILIGLFAFVYISTSQMDEPGVSFIIIISLVVWPIVGVITLTFLFPALYAVLKRQKMLIEIAEAGEQWRSYEKPPQEDVPLEKKIDVLDKLVSLKERELITESEYLKMKGDILKDILPVSKPATSPNVLTCPRCSTKFSITSDERPIVAICPNCKAKATVK